MAATAYWFGNAFLKVFNKEMDWDTDTFKLMLTTSAYTPAQAHDYKNDVTNEVTGTGYTAGGATLASKTITYTAADSWATARANTTAYTLGQIVRPATGNGHLYRAIVAGTSGGSIPTWPTVSGATVTDGAVTWAEIGIGIIAFDAADVTWGSSTITAAKGVIYCDTPATDATKPLVGYIDFGGDVVSSAGNFTVTFDAAGIFFVTI